MVATTPTPTTTPTTTTMATTISGDTNPSSKTNSSSNGILSTNSSSSISSNSLTTINRITCISSAHLISRTNRTNSSNVILISTDSSNISNRTSNRCKGLRLLMAQWDPSSSRITTTITVVTTTTTTTTTAATITTITTAIATTTAACQGKTTHSNNSSTTTRETTCSEAISSRLIIMAKAPIKVRIITRTKANNSSINNKTSSRTSRTNRNSNSTSTSSKDGAMILRSKDRPLSLSRVLHPLGLRTSLSKSDLSYFFLVGEVQSESEMRESEWYKERKRGRECFPYTKHRSRTRNIKENKNQQDTAEKKGTAGHIQLDWIEGSTYHEHPKKKWTTRGKPNHMREPQCRMARTEQDREQYGIRV